jgi:cytochrome c oxidase subunit 3
MSVEAPALHGTGEAAPLARLEAGVPTPLLGMLLFITSEVMFFGGLFAAYFNARAVHVGVWAPPPPAPELEMLPIALPITIILISSSFTMQFAVWAIRRGDQRAMRNWTALTLVLGIAFLAGQLYDYSTLGFGISDGAFGTVFYTLTGFHGAHVFGGTVGLTILVARASQGQFSARNHVAVEAISFYWHFVDVVWIALFSTLYFLR